MCAATSGLLVSSSTNFILTTGKLHKNALYETVRQGVPMQRWSRMMSVERAHADFGAELHGQHLLSASSLEQLYGGDPTWLSLIQVQLQQYLKHRRPTVRPQLNKPSRKSLQPSTRTALPTKFRHQPRRIIRATGKLQALHRHQSHQQPQSNQRQHLPKKVLTPNLLKTSSIRLPGKYSKPPP